MENKFGWALGILAALLLAALIVVLGTMAVSNQARADKLQEDLRSLTTQNRGPAGEDGRDGQDGADVTPEMVAAAVAEYCAAHGNCAGPQGPQGAPGATGKPGVNGQSIVGPAGPRGATGAAGSITSVKCFGTFIRFYVGSTPVGDIKQVCIP